MPYKSADMSLLLPTFRPKVQTVLDRMKARGFDPVMFCGHRTPEEALRNAAKKTGIVKSMHLYDAAADIICNVHGWACSTKKGGDHGFFKALGEEVIATGSVWGGDWNSNHRQEEHDTDLVHMQGVDATPEAQNAMRALGTGEESRDARDALVQKHYARR